MKKLPIINQLFLLFFLQSSVSAQTIFPEIPEIETGDIEKLQPFPDVDLADPIMLPSGIDQTTLGDQSITITEIRFEGNQVISNDDIQAALIPFYGQTIKASKLNNILDSINELYEKKGYSGSGAIFTGKNEIFDKSNAIIDLKIIEKRIIDLELVGDNSVFKLVKRSLSKNIDRPFNQKKFYDDLRFLLDEEIIDSLKVKFKPTGFINETSVQIDVEASREIELLGLLNNTRSPSSGRFERGLSFAHKNLRGLGDKLSFDYRNTDGSNLAALSYDLPVSSNGSVLGINYLYSNAEVIESPLDELQLESEINQFELSYRQPIIRKSSDRILDEFGIGVILKRIDSNESEQGQPSRLSIGSNNNGKYRSTAVSLFQYFSHKTPNENLFLDSSIDIGIPIGSANDSFFGDGSFLKFTANAQYLRQITNKFGIITIARGQITGQSLPNIEQFSIGGINSVRGFDPSILDGDSGLSFTQELKITLLNNRRHNLELAPFFDFGIVDKKSKPIFDQGQILGSLGLSLRYRFFDRLLTTLEYGQPIIGNTQSSGSRFTFRIVGKIF